MYKIGHYHATRHYGGPEEGGWWYDWFEYVKSVNDFGIESYAYTEARKLNDMERNRKATNGEYDRYSMAYGFNSAVDNTYMVETESGEHSTTERPRYE